MKKRIFPITASLDPAGGDLFRTIRGHKGKVYAMALTPDGRTIVSSSFDNQNDLFIRVWDVQTGKQIYIMEDPYENGTHKIAVTQDKIVSGWYGSIRIWDMAKGTLDHFLQDAYGFKFLTTPDGKKIISSDLSDPTIQIWDIKDGILLKKLDDHTDKITSLAVTPDSKQIISGSFDNTIRIWNIDGSNKILNLDIYATSLAVTHDNKKIIAGLSNHTILIIDLATLDIINVFKEHTDFISAIEITNDDTKVISGSHKELIVWDIKTCNKLHFISNVAISKIKITPDNKRFASISNYSKIIEIWDLNSGEKLLNFSGHTEQVNEIEITPDSKGIVSCSDDQTIKIWNLDNKLTHDVSKGHNSKVTALTVTPDSKKTISSSNDTSILIWDNSSGKISRRLPGHSGPVIALTGSLDNKKIVSGSLYNDIKVWDLNSGEELRYLTNGTFAINALRVTPDNTRIISESNGGRIIKVWDLNSGEELYDLKEHTAELIGSVITPDGTKLISGSHKELIVWDIITGKKISLINYGNTFRIFLTSDGTKLISQEFENIKVWDTNNWTLLKNIQAHTDFWPPDKSTSSQIKRMINQLQGHVTRITTCTITSDGKKIISSSSDNVIRIWDIVTGKLLGDLTGHDDQVTTLTVTPDNNNLVSSSRDNTVKLWDLENKNLLDQFTTDHPISAHVITNDGQFIIIGDDSGSVHFLHLQ